MPMSARVLLKSKPVIVALLGGVMFLALHWVVAERLVTLAYVRTAIADGQWWRLLSGHFVHFTLYHAVMNAIGLLLVNAVLLYRQTLFLLLSVNLFLPVFISLGLWWFYQDIDQYRGYSGVLYGLIAAGLILEWKTNKGLYGIALVLVAAKIAYEQLPTYDVNYLVAEIGVPVAIEAHLLGFLGGVAFALLVFAGLTVRRKM